MIFCAVVAKSDCASCCLKASARNSFLTSGDGRWHRHPERGGTTNLISFFCDLGSSTKNQVAADVWQWHGRFVYCSSSGAGSDIVAQRLLTRHRKQGIFLVLFRCGARDCPSYTMAKATSVQARQCRQSRGVAWHPPRWCALPARSGAFS